MPPIILASASPRRAGLLSALGLAFDVWPPDIDESPAPGERPGEHVLRLALAKASRAAARFPGRIVIGADTAVVLDGRIYGKPADEGEARRTLRELGGRTHEVLTGYAVLDARGGRRAGVERSLVTMRRLAEADLEGYLSLGEHADKAGAYAAQGEGAGLIERVEGSFTNVVGLPLGPVMRILGAMGVAVTDPGLDGPSGKGG